MIIPYTQQTEVYFVPLEQKTNFINTKRDAGYIILSVNEVAQTALYKITLRYSCIDLAD